MVGSLLRRLAARFAAGSDRDRARWHGTALAVALYLGIYALYSQWYIEDAAIVFAYARNAAEGLGFVPWAGAERVEGFSDPTWTLLLTALQVCGITPWIAAKLLGAALGALTIPLVVRWARAVVPDEADPRVPVLAGALLAISPQFAAWNASGLENALLAWLLARGAVDLVEGAAPARVGLWWGLVAVTRPEGAMYAGIAGIAGTLRAARGGPAAAVRWAVPCALAGALPFLGWHLARYPYFGWALPNTAYAKLWDSADFQPAHWGSYGWVYLRGWALRTAQGFALPVYVLGLTGAEGWRRRAAIGITAVLALLIVPGLAWTAEIPRWPAIDGPVLQGLRIGALALAAVAAPILGLGRPGAAGRLLAWALAVAGMYFAVYSGGDWMVGFRWLALPAVPLAVLLADAGYVLWNALDRPALRTTLGVGLLGPVLATSGAEIVRYVRSADTSPFDVADRVAYHEETAAALGLDLPPRLADVDMGAHMWWSGGPILDYAGLIDAPFAHAHWQVPFEEEYLYGELRPELIHVHGSWTSKSHLREPAAFKQDYLAIPGYPTGGAKPHDGSFLRRDAVLRPAWDGPPGREARFTAGVGGLRLAGWELRGTVFAPGAPLPLRVGWARIGAATPNLVVWAFLADAHGVVASWTLQPARDLLAPVRWKPSEVAITRELPRLPADLPPGTYDLGFAVAGQRPGTVWTGDGGDGLPPRFARGEVAWAGAVVVGAPSAAEAEISAARASAVTLGDAGRCAEAEDAYRIAKDRVDPPDPRRDDLDAPRAAIGRCVARAAEEAGDPAAMREAMRWAPRDPTVRAIGVRLADRWEQAGDAALAAGDADGAHRAWSDALAADPLRPWLRRRVEELRKARLGLKETSEVGEAPPKGEEERGG